MTDDDIEFDEADLARLQRLEAMMQDRGYRRDRRGFWVALAMPIAAAGPVFDGPTDEVFEAILREEE